MGTVQCPAAIEVKIDTFKYFVELHPGKVGEYAVTSGEKFSYVHGDADAFLIVCDSPLQVSVRYSSGVAK